MSSAASSPRRKPASKVASPDKGKGKQEAAAPVDTPMDEDVNDEDEDDEDDEDEEDEEVVDEDMEEDEDDLDEIDPSVITSRRTRGKKVDYTSPEALAKAGLRKADLEDEEDD